MLGGYPEDCPPEMLGAWPAIVMAIVEGVKQGTNAIADVYTSVIKEKHDKAAGKRQEVADRIDALSAKREDIAMGEIAKRKLVERAKAKEQTTKFIAWGTGATVLTALYLYTR